MGMCNGKLMENIQYSRHEFDLLEPPKVARIQLRTATVEDIDTAREFAQRELPGNIAAGEVLEKAILHNPDNVLAFCRNDKIVGIWAMLMLGPVALEQLLLGEFNAIDPDFRFLTPGGDTPVAIYKWAVVAPGMAAEGIRHVSRFLRQPLYLRTNFFSRPNTDVGVKLNHSLGFRPIESQTPGLFRYIRLVNRASPMSQAA